MIQQIRFTDSRLPLQQKGGALACLVGHTAQGQQLLQGQLLAHQRFSLLFYFGGMVVPLPNGLVIKGGGFL